MKTYKSEAECCADAIALQDACNLSGVANTLSAVCHYLWSLPNVPGTHWVNHHPAVHLIVAKLSDLSGWGVPYSGGIPELSGLNLPTNFGELAETHAICVRIAKGAAPLSEPAWPSDEVPYDQLTGYPLPKE